MWTRWTCVAAICLGLAPQAEAAEHSGLVHRASCTVVRFYVAKFSAFAAETWARNHGATEAEIEAARHCLKEAPAQTAQAGQSSTFPRPPENEARAAPDSRLARFASSV